MPLLQRNKLWGFLFTLLIYLGAVNLQAQQFGFKNYTTDQGLTSNNILSIFQDQDQRIFIGTHLGGVNVFNGSEFKPAESIFPGLTIPNQTVYSINRSDSLYFFGTNGGLVIYDGHASKVFSDTTGLKNYRVFKTHTDHAGITWIGTAGGLQVYDGELKNPPFSSVLDSISIFNIVSDSQSNLWFCTLTNGLYKYDGNTITHIDSIFGPKGYRFVADILEVDLNEYFIASRSGLIHLKNNQLKDFQIGKEKDTQFYGLTKDEAGNIWIGSDEGAYLFRNGKFEKFTESNGLVSNAIWDVFIDHEQSVWFISAKNGKGMSQLTSERLILFGDNELDNVDINCIIPKSDNTWYFGSENGVTAFNPISRTWRPLKDKHLEGKTILDGLYDYEKKQFYFGETNGLSVYNDQEVFQRYYMPKNNERDLSKIWDVFKDHNGEIWLGTSGGIAQIKNDFIEFWNGDGNIRDIIFDVVQHPNGAMYFATEQGLFLKKENTLVNLSEQLNFSKRRIRQLAFDTENNLWIASEDGLYKFDGQAFYKIQLSSQYKMLSLTFDQTGQIWAGLSNGILNIEFTSNDTLVTFIGQHDGFLGKECNNKALYVSNHDELFFGSNAGVSVFRKKLDKKLPAQPNLSLQLEISGINNTKDFCDGYDRYGLPLYLDLPPTLNRITFKNEVIGFKNMEKMAIEYRLVGANNTWQNGTAQEQVVYSELSYGSYTYEVRVKPQQGVIPPPAIQFTFRIQKPFYLQTWFILICVFVLSALIYSYIIIRKNNRLLNKQKDIILRQKAEVEEKNREIVDSITYAKRIQDAILPSDNKLSNFFSDYFVIYAPRDIVSGDFYWCEELDDKVYFAAADCTGHGVPGAMVSVMCSNLLRKATIEENLIDPGKILDRVAELLIRRLEGSKEQVHDGMDITLCCWDRSNNTLTFSGANNPLFLIRNGALEVFKADKQPIGFFEGRIPFTTHEITIQPKDQIVLFSDGLKDQFGGPKNKKFGSKRFQNTLLLGASLNLESQGEQIFQEFYSWKGSEEQVDDICVFSVRF